MVPSPHFQINFFHRLCTQEIKPKETGQKQLRRFFHSCCGHDGLLQLHRRRSCITKVQAPCLRLPSQPQDIAAPRLVPDYTAWWQRLVYVNSETAGIDLATSRVASERLNDSTTEPNDLLRIRRRRSCSHQVQVPCPDRCSPWPSRPSWSPGWSPQTRSTFKPQHNASNPAR